MSAEALALVELGTVAGGLRALDLLVKKAPVEVLEANLVEPGKYLILFAGGVAEVQESYDEVRAWDPDALVDRMFLPFAHPDLLAGLRGREDRPPAAELDSLGVVEGSAVASTLVACDRSLKDADVALAGVRVAGGLGGRAYYVVHGAQHDVEAAIEAGAAILEAAGALHRTERIARPHAEMVAWLLRRPPFAVRGEA